MRRILVALGEVHLAHVAEDEAIRRCCILLKPDAQPSTYLRQMMTRLRAILRHAADRGWCDAPRVAIPRILAGRTRLLLPNEAERLVECQLVERHAHLLPAGYDEAIRRFLGWHQAGTDPQAAQARA